MISTESVEIARKTSLDAQHVAELFQDAIDQARETYVNDSKTDTWSEYIHALSQYQAAARRATAARLMADAVAHAYHLEQAWERCKALPITINAAR
ncbi:hypothetical protein SEA_TAJ14_25 [Arthrobacter phage Taj14]|nr:hypothetical protein SEA_TAJ14_25 [Arthrobacter phage Taj14]QGH75246.1 hypothetical protein SEA_SAPHIRA_26 [Arthrobacter phage Saphira]